ncbi:MAG: bis(5'-nucleosyl)-tetraphosphatase (symmetrical) YqeK [Microcoleaceae cyanobacterium MO_207.B10]|nr:bis(5'-nucleosyl)-tetraphosphatase (symmetrical) YqeK [Microcoleaceae cyanobacterium MO_207.B10]
MRQEILKWLSAHVPISRVKHILRVEKMATELAGHYFLDEEKARLAGLMHDLAKYFDSQVLLKMAKSEGLEIDSVFEICPHLLHADVSAIVARKEFGIEDKEILAAIAHHTLGHPGMSKLSCVVFLADTLEPGRGKSQELESLRQLSRESLYQAVWLTSEYTIKNLLATSRLIHPRTILTRNWFLEEAKK